MLPTLRQLEYVVALASTGRFVEAARRCGVSQPALSKQIREVEALVGTPLFERTSEGATPTAAGAEVVARARRLLADARELVDAASAHAGRRLGVVQIGVIPTVAPFALPGLLVKLRALFPDASFVIHELQTPVLLERLRDRTVDVGLLAHPFDEAGLTGSDVIFEPFVLATPQHHPLAGSTPVDRAAIAGASLILMGDGHCLRDQALEVCAAAGAAPPTGVSAASVSTLVQLVESGLGATLLPVSALPVELAASRAPSIALRRFADPPPGRTLTLQWRRTSPDGPWFERIAAVLRAHYVAMNDALPVVTGAVPWLTPAPPGVTVAETSAGRP